MCGAQSDPHWRRWISSGIRLPDELHQSRAHLEPHAEALAPAPADDPSGAPDRASAFAIAAVILSSVSATSATSLPAPIARRKQALHGSRMMPAGVATWRPERGGGQARCCTTAPTLGTPGS